MFSGNRKRIFAVLFLVNTMVYISAAIYSPYLSSYYTNHGMTATQIGIILAVGPVVSVAIQPQWARLSDRCGKKKTVLTVCSIGSVVTILLPLISNTFITYLISTIAFQSFITALIPLSDTIAVTQAEKHGFQYNLIRFGGSAGWIVASYFGSLFVVRYPNLIFVIASVSYLVFLLFVRLIPKDADQAEQKPVAVLQQEQSPPEKTVLGIFKSFDCVFLLVLVFSLQLATGVLGNFNAMYVIDYRGYDQTLIGWMGVLNSLSELPMLLVMNRLIKKYGYLKLAFFACLVVPFRLVLFNINTVPTMLLAHFMQGFTYMIVHICGIGMIYEQAVPGKHAVAISSLTLVQSGIGAICASVGGGALIDMVGLENTYYIAAGVSLGVTLTTLAAYLFYRARPKKQNPAKVLTP